MLEIASHHRKLSHLNKVTMPTKNSLNHKGESSILQAIEDAEAGKNVTRSMKPKEALAYLRKL